MTRIAVISDTHIPRKGKELPRLLTESISGVDLIIHAGDINEDYVIYELEEFAPVEAVAGNTDSHYMRGMLGSRKIISVENCRIGIVHGDGASGTTLQRVKKSFENDNVNCVVFGHSHIPYNESIEGVLYFNPGSPTDKRRQEFYSCGILEVTGSDIRGKVVYFDRK